MQYKWQIFTEYKTIVPQQANEIVQKVVQRKIHAFLYNDLILVPEIYIVEEKRQLQVVLWPPYIHNATHKYME